MANDIVRYMMQESFVFEEQLLADEVAAWEKSGSDKGQIYTRPEVVEFMLDAIGLNTSEAISNARILEPSCGEGEFVVAIVDRLINRSAQRPAIEHICDKLLAVDLVAGSLEIAKMRVSHQLENRGYSKDEISILLDHWFICADFLLEEITPNFTHVIGNPPYVRVESIPKILLAEYRQRFSTMTDRADLYIPFYEKCLSLLKNKGRLSFICTDRWTKNVYGRALRKFINDTYGLELFIDLYGVNAFESDVMTYPAITQIIKCQCDQTILKHGSSFSQEEAQEILSAIRGESTSLHIRKAIVNGDKPWLLGASDQTALIKKIENEFPLLEETGCKVFIGAATGSNKIYIVDSTFVGNKIEESRLLPVLTASELKSGKITWGGRYIINTYDENGVVSLDDYPMLSRYLNLHKNELSKRHVAQKDSARWYKTIDRIYKSRAEMEKLLIPDIGNEPIVLYDRGFYYPNNSIYYICSNSWNLHALRVLLLSNITKIFISGYSTKIANGYIRFQAQHLRKLRIPHWNDIVPEMQLRLISAGKNNDEAVFNELACGVYNLSETEREIVGV